MKNIVIIGAGYGGILTAKKLEKTFRKNDEICISIIDRNPFHTMLTELHEVAANRVEEDSIQINLQKVFAGRKVTVIMDTVLSIAFSKKQILGQQGNYPYDYLVIAAGSRPTFFGVTGAKENSFPLWSYEDAVLLKERIHEMFRLATLINDPEAAKTYLSFYIVGAGFTGVEMAGELGEYIPILCDQYQIPPEWVSIFNVDILPRTVPILPEKLSAKVEKRLQKMGVSLQLDTNVIEIEKDYIVLKKDDVTTKHHTKTVIWTAGIESAEITENAAKTLESAGRNRIKVDTYLRSFGYKEVYVVGDNMMYTPPGSKEPVPQMVENCEQSAHIAAHNIICSIKGNMEKMKEYHPSFHGVMVSVGGRYGVARVGLPNMMFNLPSFFAMLSKHFINIVYFVQVLGWNKVSSYMKHEFFTIRHQRSFVGGHFSNHSPGFLLVPLRMWLGAVWLFEGIVKIVEGWLSSPMLTSFFGGANSWYHNILYGTPPPANPSLDAIASATGAVGDTLVSSGTAIFSYRILGLFDIIFVSGKDLAHSALGDYAFKLNIPAMNWFVDNVILSGDSIQIFMQTTIVILEILIGLSLIGGLFTTLSSGVSLFLQIMFVSTTGLYLNTFWMVFAPIALLFGSGRSFGLDYYVMPVLKKYWKKIPIIRRWYLYHD